MGEEETTFGALVAAGVAMLIGTKLVVGAMIAMLSVDGGTVQLLLDSMPATAVIGIVLLITTGALVARLWWGRWLAIAALTFVAVVGRPMLADPEPIAVAQTAMAIVTILYLVVANPVAKQERSEIDESTSASRWGSTIR